MILNFQSYNMINFKGTCKQGVLLLLLTLNLVAHAATDNFIIGTIFNNNHQAINSALEVYHGTVIYGNYSGNCDNAVQQTKNLITGKSVQIILSVKDDGCFSEIANVVKKFSGVLHISLQFIFIPSALDQLSVLSSDVLPTKQFAYIVLKPVTGGKKDLIVKKILQLYSKFIEAIRKPSPLKRYKVRVSFAPLREKPARSGDKPEKNGINQIIATLKKDDVIEGNADIKDASSIEDYCKRDAKKDLIYDYIYTIDWICVRVSSSQNPSVQGKTGWIHKMLIEKK